MMRHLPSVSATYLDVGWRRLWRNFLTAFVRPRNGWAPPPVLVVLRPTSRCNLRCRICFDRGEHTASLSRPAEPEGPELSTDAFLALTDLLARFRPTFYITGGEPLLSPTTLPLMARIKSRGLYVSMNTNAVMLAERAEALVSAGIDKIIVSLDGPPAAHNAVRGPVFEALARGVRAVRACREKTGQRVPALRGQCVISPHNVAVLRETVDTARDLGLDEIRFQHLMFVFDESAIRLDPFLASEPRRVHASHCVLPAGSLDLPRLREEMNAIRRASRGGPRVRFEPNIPPPDLEGYYTDPKHPFVNLCLSPWRRLDVSAWGELGPCACMYFGQYPADKPADVWNGPGFRAVRRRIGEGGIFPHCVRCCHREYYPPGIGLGVS